jgi:ubiquinone/menaquinone biosynthesis C-methylase UbiE
MNRDTLADEVRSAYNMVAEDYAARFPGTEPEQMIDLAMIDHYVSQLTDSRDVLDAGCGAGRMSRYLTDRGCVVHGVDLSPGMIAMARRDHPDIATQVASITDLPFPDARFDGLLYWYSIIHVADSDLPAVAREARRVLRPNGVVLAAFQAGEGMRDVGASYRKLGYDVILTRFERTADQVSLLFAGVNLVEEARLVRRALAAERTDQAFVLYRAPGDG